MSLQGFSQVALDRANEYRSKAAADANTARAQSILGSESAHDTLSAQDLRVLRARVVAPDASFGARY
ncbi:hypothetical protein [Antrihabitans spumae]|uniref:Uncharacterized protein n=1 Tax=Antrihabitans spumae TaxID=3373370 RepID=A0ABW7KAS9_9NOCA